MKIRVLNSASALTVALALLSPAAAVAQDSGDDTGALQEIIVTAQKRSESAQNVPIAISAVSADSLSAKGVSDISQIGNQAPNVTLKNTAAFAGSS